MFGASVSDDNGTAVAVNNNNYNYQLEATIDLLQERIAELEIDLLKEDVGWINQSGVGNNVELTKSILDRIVARSRLYFLTSPLINRAVTLQADYVFAQGWNIQATDNDINDVIQEFLDDPLNVAEIFGHQARLMKEQTLELDGNVFLILFTDKADTGVVQIRSVLVDEITDIITNPDDQNEVWYYKRQWTSIDPESRQTTSRTTLYPDIHYEPTRGKRTSLNNIPIEWDSPIKHVKVGGLAKSRYGVPETYSALDWAQAHRRMLEDWATIVRAYAKFAFSLTVAGGKRAVVAAKEKLGTTVSTGNLSERNPAPVTASIFATTKDGDKLEPIRTAGATTNAHDSRELRLMVAAALGIPDTFFGDADVGSMATAKTLDRPTELKFRSRQQLWTDVVTDILRYVVRWSVIAPKGMLAKKKSTIIDARGKLKLNDTKIDTHLEVTFPPILEHSVLDRITAVVDAVTLNGKAFAIDSPELQKVTMRMLLQALGAKDTDEIVDSIFADVKQPDPNNPTNNPNANPNQDGGTNAGNQQQQTGNGPADNIPSTRLPTR